MDIQGGSQAYGPQQLQQQQDPSGDVAQASNAGKAQAVADSIASSDAAPVNQPGTAAAGAKKPITSPANAPALPPPNAQTAAASDQLVQKLQAQYQNVKGQQTQALMATLPPSTQALIKNGNSEDAQVAKGAVQSTANMAALAQVANVPTAQPLNPSAVTSIPAAGPVSPTAPPEQQQAQLLSNTLTSTTNTTQIASAAAASTSSSSGTSISAFMAAVGEAISNLEAFVGKLENNTTSDQSAEVAQATAQDNSTLLNSAESQQSSSGSGGLLGGLLGGGSGGGLLGGLGGMLGGGSGGGGIVSDLLSVVEPGGLMKMLGLGSLLSNIPLVGPMLGGLIGTSGDPSSGVSGEINSTIGLGGTTTSGSTTTPAPTTTTTAAPAAATPAYSPTGGATAPSTTSGALALAGSSNAAAQTTALAPTPTTGTVIQPPAAAQTPTTTSTTAAPASTTSSSGGLLGGLLGGGSGGGLGSIVSMLMPGGLMKELGLGSLLDQIPIIGPMLGGLIGTSSDPSSGVSGTMTGMLGLNGSSSSSSTSPTSTGSILSTGAQAQSLGANIPILGDLTGSSSSSTPPTPAESVGNSIPASIAQGTIASNVAQSGGASSSNAALIAQIMQIITVLKSVQAGMAGGHMSASSIPTGQLMTMMTQLKSDGFGSTPPTSAGATDLANAMKYGSSGDSANMVVALSNAMASSGISMGTSGTDATVNDLSQASLPSAGQVGSMVSGQTAA